MRVGDTMVIHVVDRIDGTCAMPRHSLANICLCLLTVLPVLFLVGPAYATIDTLFVRPCLQRVIEKKILPFTMHNRLQRSTVHYAGGRHHGNPCCRPHWRHMCHAQAFFGKPSACVCWGVLPVCFLLAQHMQPLTLFLSGLSTKGHRKEDPSFYYAQSLAT